METIEARGLSCPEPVVLTRNALRDKPASLAVLVDDFAPRENVTRFAKHEGYDVEVVETEDGWTLNLTK